MRGCVNSLKPKFKIALMQEAIKEIEHVRSTIRICNDSKSDNYNKYAFIEALATQIKNDIRDLIELEGRKT